MHRLTGIKATQRYLTDPPPTISFTKTGPVAIQDSCFFFLPSFMGPLWRLGPVAAAPVAPPILTPLILGWNSM